MTKWTLEKAKNSFSEVVRRALDHSPQLVVRGNRPDEAVIVIARADYEKLIAPRDLVDFMRDSPLAKAMAARDTSGSVDQIFGRRKDAGRPVDLG